MLGDVSKAEGIYIAVGHTDMRTKYRWTFSNCSAELQDGSL